MFIQRQLRSATHPVFANWLTSSDAHSVDGTGNTLIASSEVGSKTPLTLRKDVWGMTPNFIWLWISSYEALENVEYPFTAITPSSSQIQSNTTLSRTELFTKISHWIESWAKINKLLRNKNAENVNMNVQWTQFPNMYAQNNPESINFLRSFLFVCLFVCCLFVCFLFCFVLFFCFCFLLLFLKVVDHWFWLK